MFNNSWAFKRYEDRRKEKSFRGLILDRILDVNFFCQKSKFLSNIEIFNKNRNFYQNSKFLSKLEIFIKTRNFYKNSKFLSTVEIFYKNRIFLQKSKFLSEIEFFYQKSNLIFELELIIKENSNARRFRHSYAFNDMGQFCFVFFDKKSFISNYIWDRALPVLVYLDSSFHFLG